MLRTILNVYFKICLSLIKGKVIFTFANIHIINCHQGLVEFTYALVTLFIEVINVSETCTCKS